MIVERALRTRPSSGQTPVHSWLKQEILACHSEAALDPQTLLFGGQAALERSGQKGVDAAATSPVAARPAGGL